MFKLITTIGKYPNFEIPINRIFYENDWDELEVALLKCLSLNEPEYIKGALAFWRDSVVSFGNTSWIEKIQSNPELVKKLNELLYNKDHFVRSEAVYTYGKTCMLEHIRDLYDCAYYCIRTQSDPVLINEILFETNYLSDDLNVNSDQVGLLEALFNSKLGSLQLCAADGVAKFQAPSDGHHPALVEAKRRVNEQFSFEFYDLKLAIYDFLHREGKNDYTMADSEEILNQLVNQKNR